MTPTTRKFSRTLNEAFPNTVEYSSAIQRPHVRKKSKLFWFVICISAIYGVVFYLSMGV